MELGLRDCRNTSRDAKSLSIELVGKDLFLIVRKKKDKENKIPKAFCLSLCPPVAEILLATLVWKPFLPHQFASVDVSLLAISKQKKSC